MPILGQMLDMISAISAKRKWLITICITLLSGLQNASSADIAQELNTLLPKTLPWDINSLSKPPIYVWLDSNTPVRSLLYDGPPFKGNSTKIFAYYTTPGLLSGDASKDSNLPAMVLVHGGGGTAFKEWVEIWARRGYAAIAMDLSGCQPEPNYTRLPQGGPMMDEKDIFGNVDAPIMNQWPYHAVADVILAHSLIISFQEVNSNKTGITGISWGGFLTCITVGVDKRFKAAVAVYGCGFISDASAWLPDFAKMQPSHKEKWVNLWDPSVYIGSASVPLFFVTGTNDPAYWLESYAKTYRLVKGEHNLRITPNMPHDYVHAWAPPEIGLFVDQYLKGGTPLPRIKLPRLRNGFIEADVDAKTKLTKAEVFYTIQNAPNIDRKWSSIEARIQDVNIIAKAPPADIRIYFVTVTDERGAMVSSELVWLPVQQTPESTILKQSSCERASGIKTIPMDN